MENENFYDTKQKFEEFLDEFLSSRRAKKIIKKILNENPYVFKIKAKGEERANKIIKKIESSNLIKLIPEYLQAVEEVKKNRKLSLEDKLKKLIPPLKKIQKILFANCLKYHQFIDDRIIDIKKELDFQNLTPNHNKYSILDTLFQEHGLLETHGRNIWLSEQYECYLVFCRDVNPISESDFERIYEKEISPEIKSLKISPRLNSTLQNKVVFPPRNKSISGIWPDWLLTLNQGSIKNNDLLTQVLVCYTIKRALNGDEKAIQKLCDLYNHVAQGIALRIGMKFHLPREIFKDMKQDATIQLRLIIGGFRPDYILKQLVQVESGRTIMAFPKWVKRFYVYYFSEYLPKSLKEMVKEAEGISEGSGKDIWFIELVTLFNPYVPIQAGTIWKHTPKRENRFNSYSYRPIKMGPKRNLTTWLFGTKGQYQYGKLYQLLRDKYKPINRKLHETKNFDFQDEFEENGKHNLTIQEKKNALRAKGILIINKSPKDIIDRLRKIGVSKRNAKIFTEWKFRKITQRELASKYRLSEQWIRKIFRNVEKLISNQ